jgi:hypothetical protein
MAYDDPSKPEAARTVELVHTLTLMHPEGATVNELRRSHRNQIKEIDRQSKHNRVRSLQPS